MPRSRRRCPRAGLGWRQRQASGSCTRSRTPRRHARRTNLHPRTHANNVANSMPVAVSPIFGPFCAEVCQPCCHGSSPSSTVLWPRWFGSERSTLFGWDSSGAALYTCQTRMLRVDSLVHFGACRGSRPLPLVALVAYVGRAQPRRRRRRGCDSKRCPRDALAARSLACAPSDVFWLRGPTGVLRRADGRRPRDRARARRFGSERSLLGRRPPLARGRPAPGRRDRTTSRAPRASTKSRPPPRNDARVRRGRRRPPHRDSRRRPRGPRRRRLRGFLARSKVADRAHELAADRRHARRRARRLLARSGREPRRARRARRRHDRGARRRSTHRPRSASGRARSKAPAGSASRPSSARAPATSSRGRPIACATWTRFGEERYAWI